MLDSRLIYFGGIFVTFCHHSPGYSFLTQPIMFQENWSHTHFEFTKSSEARRGKKRGNSTAHVKVMCVKRRTIIRRMCLSSQGSLRSCLPLLLGWTLGRVLIQTTCSAFSCHSTSCDLQLLRLLVELSFWSTSLHLWSQSENIYLVFLIKSLS